MTAPKPNLDAPSTSPPRRRIFDLGEQVPESPVAPVAAAEPAAAPEPEAVTPPRKQNPASVAPAPAAPTPAPGAAGKKRGPKPSAEPLEHVTFKLKPAHRQQLDDMLADAPRHVLKQDLMEFILADFFERHPRLPEVLRKSKARRK